MSASSPAKLLIKSLDNLLKVIEEMCTSQRVRQLRDRPLASLITSLSELSVEHPSHADEIARIKALLVREERFRLRKLVDQHFTVNKNSASRQALSRFSPGVNVK